MAKPRNLLPVLLLPLAAAAQTDDATLLRCARIADATPRLACFDELAERVRRRADSPAPPAPAPAAVASPDPRRVADFGKPPKPDPGDIDVVETYLPGAFSGWSPRQRFTLANGQVWEITDDSSAFGRGSDVPVKLRRGALGSFFIEFATVTKSPRAKRVE